jgi:hypothetical protein
LLPEVDSASPALPILPVGFRGERHDQSGYGGRPVAGSGYFPPDRPPDRPVPPRNLPTGNGACRRKPVPALRIGPVPAVEWPDTSALRGSWLVCCPGGGVLGRALRECETGLRGPDRNTRDFTHEPAPGGSSTRKIRGVFPVVPAEQQ